MLHLWSEKDTGSFYIALKKIRTDETMLFGIDGTILPASEFTDAAEVHLSSPLIPDKIEAVLNFLKPHYVLQSRLAIVLAHAFHTGHNLNSAASFRVLVLDRASNCLKSLLKLSEPSI